MSYSSTICDIFCWHRWNIWIYGGTLVGDFSNRYFYRLVKCMLKEVRVVITKMVMTRQPHAREVGRWRRRSEVVCFVHYVRSESDPNPWRYGSCTDCQNQPLRNQCSSTLTPLQPQTKAPAESVDKLHSQPLQLFAWLTTHRYIRFAAAEQPRGRLRIASMGTALNMYLCELFHKHGESILISKSRVS